MHSPTTRHGLLLPMLLAIFVASAACSGKSKRERPDPVEPKVEETGPSGQELYVRANEKLDAGSWKAAIKKYDEAIEADPERWEFHMNRGIALTRVARFNEAISAFERALRNGGEERPEIYFNLGNLYQERGLYSQAVDAYRTSLAYEDSPNVDTLLNLAAAYVFLRQWDAATTTYEYIRSLAPDDPRAPHGLALIMQHQDQYADAAEAYERIHTIDPNFELPYFNKARCYAAMKEHAKAIQALRDYLRVAPDAAYAKRAKAMIDVYKERMEKER